MNSFRRVHVSLLAALVGCGCAAMLAFGPREREAASHERGGVIINVDYDAQPGGDGLTWRSAIRFLQDALDAAREPRSGVTEIRIAQGEYKPDQGASVTPGDAALLVAGEVIGDEQVGIKDLLAVIASWGLFSPPPAPCLADLNGDGEVAIDDLLSVISQWG